MNRLIAAAHMTQYDGMGRDDWQGLPHGIDLEKLELSHSMVH